MINIQIDSTVVEQMLDRVQRGGGNLSHLMVGIREALRSQTEQNFEAEGRPSWQALADATKEKRRKAGHWPGKILQVKGSIARGLVVESNDRMALIGVGRDVKHAAMHQLGGQAGRGLKVTIPERPYLPMGADQKLQPEAEAALRALVLHYLVELARD